MTFFSTILDCIGYLIDYHKSKTMEQWRSEERILKHKLRQSEYDSKKFKLNELTKDLAISKFKLAQIKKKSARLPKEYADIIMPLIDELEHRIEQIRMDRKNV